MTSNSMIAQHTADKLAIAEALYKYAAGIDLRDKELFASALTEDAVSDFRTAAAKAGFEYPMIEGGGFSSRPSRTRSAVWTPLTRSATRASPLTVT